MRHTRKHLKKRHQTHKKKYLKKTKRHTKHKRSLRRKLRKGGGYNPPSEKYVISFSYYGEDDDPEEEDYEYERDKSIYNRLDDAEKSFDEKKREIFDYAIRFGEPINVYLNKVYPDGSREIIKETELEY